MSLLKPLLVMLVLLTPFNLYAENAVKEYNLKNGLKVLMTEDHKAPLAVFQIWYRVGSRDEVSGKTGISHLLEHMMFKGTPSHGPSELSKLVQRLGGSDNAFTSKDYTVYFQTMPSDKINLSVELESDRMVNLLLDEKETVSERSVVMEERRMRSEDDPQSALGEEVMAASFKAHQYGWPIIGWMSDLKGIERDDVLKHYRENYCPGNAVIIISGDINPDEMIKNVEASFGSIAPCPAMKRRMPEEPPQKGERRVYLKKEAELPYIIISYHTPSFPDKDSFALNVLASALSGKSGRLYKSLVYEKKLALGSSADYSDLSKDPFLFFIDGTATPGTDIKDLERSINDEIDSIKMKSLTETEIQKAKNQVESSFIMGQDSLFYQALVLGWFEMVGDWRLKSRYIDGIRAVTAEDIKRVSNTYLTEDNRTVGILIPTKGGM